MRLPTEWVKEGLVLADGARLFGVPFDEMTNDELIAAAAHGWALKREADARESESSIRHIRDLAAMSAQTPCGLRLRRTLEVAGQAGELGGVD